MKIPINKRTNSKKIAVAAVLLLAVIMGGAYLVYAKMSPSTPKDSPAKTTASSKTPSLTEPATDEQKAAGNAIKKDSLDKANQTSTPMPSDLSITITAAQQTGNMIRIRASITPLLSKGVCTLTLTQGSKVITKTADIQNLNAYSTCKGFDIANSELAPGSWTAKILVTSGNMSGMTTTKVEV